MIDKNDPRLTAFVLGELDDSERREIQNAIKSSPELQAAIDEIRSVCDSLQHSFADELEIPAVESTVTLANKDKPSNSSADQRSRWVNWAAACSIAILAASIAIVLTVESGSWFGIDLTGGIETSRGDLMLPDWTMHTPITEPEDGTVEQGIDSDWRKNPADQSVVVEPETEPDAIDAALSSIQKNNEEMNWLRDNKAEISWGPLSENGDGDAEAQEPQKFDDIEFSANSFAMHDRRTDDVSDLPAVLLPNEYTVGDFLSGGEIPIDVASGKVNQNAGSNRLKTDGRSRGDVGGQPVVTTIPAQDIVIVRGDPNAVRGIEEYLDELRSNNGDSTATGSWSLRQLPKPESDTSPAKQIEGTVRQQLQGGGGRGKSEIVDVEEFTYDSSQVTQRASDEELVDDLLRQSSGQTESLLFNADRVGQALGLANLQSQMHTSRADRDTKEKALQAEVDFDDLQFNQNSFSTKAKLDRDAELRGNEMVKSLEEQLKNKSSEDLLRAGFDVDKQIIQSQVQLQTALQKFGPSQPAVKSLAVHLKLLQEFKWKSADRPTLLRQTAAKDIIPNLLRRVKPSGTQEIDINQIILDPNMLEGEFTHVVESHVEASQRKHNELPVNDAIGYLNSIEDESERNQARKELIEETNRQLREFAKAHNRKIRGWRKVKATGNSSRLIVGDKDELDLTGMQVHVQVDGFRARVLIDYFYYNDRDRQLEGNFKMRLPDDASLYYFAFGQSAYDFSPNGPLAGGEFVDGSNQYVSLRPTEIGLARQDAWKNVKEARMVPREKAAFAYSQTVRRRVDPALVEWSGAGIFNARVFPLMPKKLHRIVMGYDVNLSPNDDGMVYKLELPTQMGECRVDLSVTDFEKGKWELQLEQTGKQQDIEPTVWESPKANTQVVSQKRFRFESPDWDTLKLTSKVKSPLVLESPKTALNNGKGNFFATQFKVDLPADQNSGSQRAVFVVDTSLSSRPEKFNIWLDLMKATLDNNRDDLKQFAVLFFDVDCRFWRSEWSENNADNVKSLLADCHQIGLEGATNLHGAMLELGEAKWLKETDETPDVFLLSDGAANWGETNLRLLEQEFASLDLGNLFAYQTGLNGTAISNLRYLAGSSGGAVFSVATENEIQAASTAHRNKPWKLNAISADGISDVMTAGRVQWIYPGQLLTVVGRGQIASDLQLELADGSTAKTISITKPIAIESEMADRMYGHVAVGQLETLGDTLFDVSAAYARHFRITGQTCSLLMLESEADYRRFDIKPKEDWFVVQSKSASTIVSKTLAKVAESLADPKSQLLQWIERLENMPVIEFKMPTALKIAMDDMTIEAIDSRLDIEIDDKDNWSKKYVENLSAEKLDAVSIDAEMQRRRKDSPDAALRAYSNLIESNPGDWVAARDVAFTAMDLKRPAAAYHLLRKVIRNRPYEGTTYAALGQCLDQLRQADMAMIFYELALGATFQNQGSDFHKIVATQYHSMLQRIVRGELNSGAREYAVARMDSLSKLLPVEKSDLVVMMMWNTDQTDVDLHVVEPGGEECSYQNRSTESGGKITADDTNGFGPEMYSIPLAKDGTYDIKIKFFSSNQNRTKVANKVYLTVYENFGTKNETRSQEVIVVNTVGKKELVKTIKKSRPVEGVCLRFKDKIAAISIGSDDGLESGMTVSFYRGDQFIGRGEVARVKGSMSAVRVLGNAKIAEGDHVHVK